MGASTSETVNVRHAVAEDWVWIYAILQSPGVIQFMGYSSPPSQEIVRERWLRRLAESNVHTLVAEIDGRVVGYIRLKQGQGKASHVGEISTLAVHEAWQNHGVGTELAKAILSLADGTLRLKRLRLTVHADNQAALRIYERLDFEIEGRERKATYRDEKYVDILIMGRINDHIASRTKTPARYLV